MRKELFIDVDLYDKLRGPFKSPIELEHGFLVQMPLPEVGRCEIEDEVISSRRRTFGTAGSDFQRLALNLNIQLPGGLVLVNLDRNRTLLWTPTFHYNIQWGELHTALRWMQKTPLSFGLCVTGHGANHRVECTLIGMVQYLEHAPEYLEQRRRILVEEIMSWH